MSNNTLPVLGVLMVVVLGGGLVLLMKETQSVGDVNNLVSGAQIQSSANIAMDFANDDEGNTGASNNDLNSHLQRLQTRLIDSLDKVENTLKQKLQDGLNAGATPLRGSHERKAPFELITNPAKGTVQASTHSERYRSSAHICTGRDFTNNLNTEEKRNEDAAESSETHAHCYFRHLCVAPGIGPVPREYRTRGFYRWFYLYDRSPPSSFREVTDNISFTLGTGPHQVDKKVFVDPKLISVSEFMKEFAEIRVEPALTHIFYEFNGENFGHMLSDVLLPIYAIMAGFDVLDYDVQLVRYQITHDLGYSCDFQVNPDWADPGWIPDVIRNPDRAKMCEKFYKMLIPAVTSRPVLVLGDLFNKTQTPVCFEKLLVGTPMLSDDCVEGDHGRELDQYNNCNSGRMEQFWAFRKYTKANLGVTDLAPTIHHVVIWDRADSTRELVNLQTLAETIRTKFDVKVTVVDWAKLDIQSQLKLIGSATVHITGPGGGSFIALFLPRSATSIRLYSEDFGMEFHIFNHLGYIHCDYRNALDGVIDIPDVLQLVRAGMHRYETFNGVFDTGSVL
eukprot:m.99827 g.99827  ORF g.99827 m.99827 type:complete len:563 (-) comp27193_c0_seq2:145-1833(-)